MSRPTSAISFLDRLRMTWPLWSNLWLQPFTPFEGVECWREIVLRLSGQDPSG
jgi:hypothetical protein